MAFCKRIVPVLMLALLCAFFSACTADIPAAAATVAPTEPAPVHTAAPTPEPQIDADGLCAMCAAAFSAAFTPDFSGADYTSQGMLDMPALIEKQPLYAKLASDTRALAQACAQAAAQDAKAEGDIIERTSVTINGEPDWRLMATVCTMLDAPEAAIAAHTDVSVTIEGKTLSICVSLPDFDALFASLASDVHYGAMSLYSYLNTTYDINAEIMDNDGTYELSREYIATIMDPLPYRHIKDGWYGDRSKATRRHMGTDIRAREGQNIPSCTAGTVVRIAYNDIAGNYVTVKDDYGFYYSYCHMVELTDFLSEGDRVEQGQLIGHVGNTGNSDAPHLHLSIIAPEYVYINPYPVLARVRYGR